MTLPIAFSKQLPPDLANYFTNFFKENKKNFDSNWIEDEATMLAL